MKKINTDIFLFKGVVAPSMQIELADYYNQNKDKFYTPVLKSGHKMNITMNCLGKHWNAKDYRYYSTRTDVDQEKVDLIPEGIITEIAKPLSATAFPYHNPSWDVCICNHYHPNNSRLGLHQDNSESSEALSLGHPIVSISIGAQCLFTIGKSKQETEDVLLENGDVLIFGGKSRLFFHGVKRIYKTELSDDLNKLLDGGRLNFTLRKY